MKNLFFVLLTCSALFSSCETDDPVIPNEEEVITTVNFTLTPSGGGTPVVMSFRDLDGDGGNAPTITSGVLAANSTYTGSVQFLNELETPAEDITEEVEEEDDEHQLFYATTGGITVSYLNTDGDGLPLGLMTEVNTSAAGAGTITITLRHEPNKSAMGVSDGNIANAGGETDIEVSFAVNVQ